MRAGHRGVLDDGDFRIGIAEYEVWQRAGLHQLLDWDLGRAAPLSQQFRAKGTHGQRANG